MGIRRSWAVLVVLLTPALAGASDHNFEVFFAPSALFVKGSTSDVYGWHAGASAVTPWFGKKLSFIGDISSHFVGKDAKTGADLTQTSVLVGPRFTFLSGKSHDFMPFVHVVFLGAVVESRAAAGATPALQSMTGSFAVGAGFDVSRGDTPEEKNWGTRLQFDYIQPIANEAVHKSFRLSIGVIYRFHDPHPEEKAVKEKKGS
jgi:hypothetical protein